MPNGHLVSKNSIGFKGARFFFRVRRPLRRCRDSVIYHRAINWSDLERNRSRRWTLSWPWHVYWQSMRSSWRDEKFSACFDQIDVFFSTKGRINHFSSRENVTLYDNLIHTVSRLAIVAARVPERELNKTYFKVTSSMLWHTFLPTNHTSFRVFQTVEVTHTCWRSTTVLGKMLVGWGSTLDQLHARWWLTYGSSRRQTIASVRLHRLRRNR